MSLTPREKKVIQAYLVDGMCFADVRRLLNAAESRIGRVSVERLKQILAKAGRKALFYNKFFEATHNAACKSGGHRHGPSCLGFDSQTEEVTFVCDQ